MKKFKRNKKVFVVWIEDVVQGRIVERKRDGYILVKLENGEYEPYHPKEVFYMRKNAERWAEAVRAEHERLNNEAIEEAAQASYWDVIEQGLVPPPTEIEKVSNEEQSPLQIVLAKTRMLSEATENVAYLPF